MYITGWTKSLIFYICERHRSCAAIVRLLAFLWRNQISLYNLGMGVYNHMAGSGKICSLIVEEKETNFKMVVSSNL